jgi:tRNA(Arg) A34 adenosine deaminase TadA
MTHEDYLNKAITIAQKSMAANQGGPFGCVVVKDGEIIAEGTNAVTSTNDPSAHAEMVAIRKACQKLNSFQLTDCVIYTSCEPCPMCLGAIYWARPKAVYFASTRQDAANIGFDDQFIYDELNKPLAERKIPFHKVNLESAANLFENWDNKADKAEY